MKKNIAHYIIFYWLFLLIWQNVFTSSLRGTADTIIKLLLLVYLSIGFINNSGLKIQKCGIILVFMFISTMVFSLVFNDLFSPYFGFDIILYYAFPCVYVFFCYSMGNTLKLDSYEFRIVNKIVILVALIGVLYTLIFEREQFILALNATNGYGNELHGFFSSMYEFALYLFYAIACCIREIDDCSSNGKRKKWYYYPLMGIFFFTMVLTFNRTAIVSCIAYLLIYSLMNKQSKVRKVIICGSIIIVILCLIIPQLREYVFETIWKGGISNSRERLYDSAMDYYHNGTLTNKIFGRGVGETRKLFKEKEGYASVHNGYLQILIYYGWIGISWIVVMTIVQIKKIIKCSHYDKMLAIESAAFLAAALLTLIPQTVIIFNSSIDAFFLTSFMIVLPRYRMNYAINSFKQGYVKINKDIS